MAPTEPLEEEEEGRGRGRGGGVSAAVDEMEPTDEAFVFGAYLCCWGGPSGARF